MRVSYLIVTCFFVLMLNIIWMRVKKPYSPILIYNMKKKHVYFPLYVLSLWGYLFLGGYFEKKLISVEYVNPTFIMFFTRIFSYMLSGFILRYKVIRPMHPSPFSIPAVMNVLATCGQMESLVFVSFQEFGASKALRLLLLGFYGAKRRLEMFLWVVVALLSAIFMFSYKFDPDKWVYPGRWGVIWLVIFIFSDSLTSITQEEIYKKFKVPSVQMMFYINFWILCVITPQLLLDFDIVVKSVSALSDNPWSLIDLGMLTLASSCAQYFALCIIRNFGALAFVFICTLKTLLTIAFIKYFTVGIWDWYEIIELISIFVIVCYIILKRKPWKKRNTIPKALTVDLMPLISED